MYRFKNIEMKKHLIVLLIIFLITCIGTSVYYGGRLTLGDLETYNNDDVKYIRSADTLIKTGKLTYRYPDTKTVFIMPGIVLTLVPFVLMFGQVGAIVAFRIFNAILQTFTLFVLFLIFKKIFKSEKIGLVGIVLNLFYTANIYVTTQILSETIFICLLINLIYICLFAVKEKNKKLYIIGGIVWGISIMFKPIMLAFPINILILMLVNKYKFKEIVIYAFIPIGIVLLLLIPWWIRNYISFGKFIPLTISSGNPKLQGAYINYDQNPPYKNEINFSNTGEFGDEIQTDEVETKMADAVIKYNLKYNTGEFIYWNTIGKTLKNFGSPFIWYPLYGIRYITYHIIHYIYLLLGIVGVIITVFNKKYKENKVKYMLFSTIIFFNMVHLPFYCFSRYVYPIMPILIGFSGITIILVIEIIFKKIRRRNEEISDNTSI